MAPRVHDAANRNSTFIGRMTRNWLSLIALEWLSGNDGRPAYWKVILTGLFGVYVIIIWHTVDAVGFLGALYPLLWWTALLLAGSFGLKGLDMWFNKATFVSSTSPSGGTATRVEATSSPATAAATTANAAVMPVAVAAKPAATVAPQPAFVPHEWTSGDPQAGVI